MRSDHEVALYWGDAMLDVRRVPTKGALVVGDVEVEPSSQPGSFAVRLPDGSLSIVNADHPCVMGPLTLLARPATGNAVPRLAARLDVEFLSWLAIVAIGTGLLWKAFGLTDGSKMPWEDDLIQQRRSYQTFHRPPPPPVKKPMFTAPSGAPAAGKAGLAGNRNAPKRSVIATGRRAESAGLLGALDALGKSPVTSPGPSLAQELKGVGRGSRMADSRGLEGMGARGTGSGGGGDVVGIGGLNGPGDGAGGTGTELFGLDRGTWKASAVQLVQVAGDDSGLDRAVVARVIRNHWNEIRYCYEKELSRDPNLAGKVAVAFDIGPVGEVTVASISESTLESAAARTCMLDSVRRWKFPAPRGGAIVQVRYPFVFTTQGG